MKTKLVFIVVLICSLPSYSFAQSEEFSNSIGMKFKLIPAGSFKMGSETGNEDERPVHHVKLSSFYMGVYEVTQAQYEKIIGKNPSVFKGENLPVEMDVGAESAENLLFFRQVNDLMIQVLLLQSLHQN